MSALSPLSTNSAAVPNHRRETVFDIALLVVVCLLATLPVLTLGAPDMAFDGFRHIGWGGSFATQFWHGDWYPRWFSRMNGGLGACSGFFYPPLAHYAVALFWPFRTARDPQGWMPLGYSLLLAEILSAIAAYLWLRSIAKPKAALLGSILYAIAPYHLAIDLYQRSAAAEFWLFVWFPLLMLSAQALIRRFRWALPLAAASYALAVLSHPTVSLCFAPVVVIYVALFSDSKQLRERVKAAALMSAALLLGVALDAVYLLPAILDQSKIHIEWQTSRYDYQNHWLIQDQQQLRAIEHSLRVLFVERQPGLAFTYAWARDAIFIATACTVAAVLTLLLLALVCEKRNGERRAVAFYTMLALASVFLMNQVSSPIWHAIPFLKFLQFPFRLNVMVVIAVAALAALTAPYLWQRRVRLITVFLFVIVAGWVAMSIHESQLVYSSLRYAPEWSEVKNVFFRLQLDEPSMWPAAANWANLSTIPAFDDFLAAHPPQTAELELMRGQIQGSAGILKWQPRRVLLQISAPEQGILILNHFYYLGWRARIEGTINDLPLQASPDGLIEVKVPAGTYRLVIKLPKDTAEQAGALISFSALLLFAASLIYLWLPRTRRGSHRGEFTRAIARST